MSLYAETQAPSLSNPFRRSIMVLVWICAMLVLSGCREVLYTGLNEEDANELTAVLLERNVDASKVNGGKAGFSVEVNKQDFVKAISIARDHSLPRNQFVNLGSVFTGQNMISSQTEERSRLSFAISQELSATIEKIDGVMDARVHVVLTEYDQMSGRTTLPSASVFIRHTRESPAASMLAGIKETVSKAVPGLEVSNVSVMTEEYTPDVYTPAPKETFGFVETLMAVSGVILLVLASVAAVLYLTGFRITRTVNKDSALNDSNSDSESAER